MPNKRIHVAAGAPVGLACAVVNSLDQSGLNAILEMLGGLCGGSAGAVLPDVIDPPNHPRHRSCGHGAVPVGAAVVLWTKNLRSWQDALRRQADRYQAQRISTNDCLEALGYRLAEWICRFLAGFAAGLGAGYISHIMLDFGTPSCIPLVV